MALRHLTPALVGILLLATRLGAQGSTGTITGRVMDGPSRQPLAGVTMRVEGTTRGAITRDDGTYRIVDAPAGVNRVRATRIGFGPQQLDVTVTPGGTATADFTMQPQAAVLEGVVVTGYGTQRREAITGSVATVDAEQARVGVVTNPEQMIQGRVAGVQITQNNGEPGSGVQIRIRGGTSISASNEPLYVIDGVPIQNVETETRAMDAATSASAALPRNPLNLLNPADIQSITILKDAAATAIYGSRAANGVILIETKKGAAGGASTEYDGYVGVASPARTYDLVSAGQYRAFAQEQVALNRACVANPPTGVDCTRVGLAPASLDALGPANTDWQDEVLHNATTQNHNLAFAGGRGETQYRASVNYMDQQGIAVANSFQRLQGRLNGNHQTFENRLRLNINLTASQVENDYLPFENTGGFEGGVFQNVVIFNPTQPVRTTDGGTGTVRFFEVGTGRQSIRNPLAMANQIADVGTTSRILGNIQGELDLMPGLTASLNFGGDRSTGVRKTYLPKSSPIGAEFNGRARQADRTNQALTLQSLLTYRREMNEEHRFDVVGGYEYSEYENDEFWIDVRNFLTDAFSFNNLGASNAQTRNTFSWAEESRLVSFFGRANYSFRDRYFLTGVLRRDGSSRFGEGNKWAVFPAISASWRISKEPFMANMPFSDLRIRAGYGLQGNPGVPPYASLILLETAENARYGFGDVTTVGVAPSRNPNPNLKWEQTAQFNVAADYGFRNNTISGSIEYYRKNTKDLLLTVFVPQPAAVDTMIQNIGKVQNQGIEASLDALALSRRNLSATLGLVFTAERSKVVDLGGRSFIGTGGVSGQGQSGQLAQRIIPGEPLGTFYGPVFVGVNNSGQQLFRCNRTTAGCTNGQTTAPTADDYDIIGNANPDFTLGIRSQANWGQFDLSFLIRSEVGQEVFNNTALVYSTKGNALQGKNFLRDALTDGIGLREPAIFSSKYIENGSFTRLQNVTIGYTFNTLPAFAGPVRNARVYVSGDNLLLLTGYSGIDPEVHVQAGLASRGIDYLTYPRPRTFTAGVRAAF
ncbi:MAG: SusC/RagA family TonB-linked outer membrane protein [Gemmatimonadaceae bacterium]